jgi:hypothetical protein
MPDMKTAGYGKDAPWKSPLDFPTSLGNPAKAAGFPLSAQPLLLLLTKNMTTTDRVTFPFEATRTRGSIKSLIASLQPAPGRLRHQPIRVPHLALVFR